MVSNGECAERTQLDLGPSRGLALGLIRVKYGLPDSRTSVRALAPDQAGWRTHHLRPTCLSSEGSRTANDSISAMTGRWYAGWGRRSLWRHSCGLGIGRPIDSLKTVSAPLLGTVLAKVSSSEPLVYAQYNLSYRVANLCPTSDAFLNGTAQQSYWKDDATARGHINRPGVDMIKRHAERVFNASVRSLRSTFSAKIKSPTRSSRLLLLRLRKLRRLASHADYWAALSRGVLPATEHQDSGLTREASTVLDVGASRGQFALFARQRWPRATIVCFEPIPEAATKLQEVLGDSVALHRTALGAANDTRLLNLSQSDDSSSILPIGRQATEFPGTGAVGVMPVDVAPLSDYVDASSVRPVVLKIDVQGYELEVLRGAGSNLRYVDEVLCECSFVKLYDGQPLAADVICHLREHGFRLVHVAGITTSDSGEQLQADFLFRRS